jgi:hypothetical protein
VVDLRDHPGRDREVASAQAKRERCRRDRDERRCERRDDDGEEGVDSRDVAEEVEAVGAEAELLEAAW